MTNNMTDEQIEKIAQAIAAKMAKPGGPVILGCGDSSSSQNYDCGQGGYDCWGIYECGGAGSFNCLRYNDCHQGFQCYSAFTCPSYHSCSGPYNT